jgi:hypothetical protein
MKRQTVLSQKQAKPLAKKRRGPAPTGKGTLIGVRLQPRDLDRLDAWAAQQDDTPSRPEALRRLAGIALDGVGVEPHVRPAARTDKKRG